MHALEYFPEGPDQFYDELVWAFHSIPGGESLPWDGEYEYKTQTPANDGTEISSFHAVESVLRQLFGFGFQLSVHTGTVGSAGL